MVRNKLSQFGDVMRSAGCDALLITSIENIRYLTGFTGSSGFLLATAGEGIFFTDSRYTEQAKSEVKGFEVKGYKKRVPELAAAIIGAGFERVGFEDFNLTYSGYRELKRELKGVRLIPVKERLLGLRCRKGAGEVRLISGAARIACSAFRKVLPSIRPGRREADLAAELEYAVRECGAEAPSFEAIVASGRRSALPHGRPSDKTMRVGEPVVIDFGARYKGYHSDETVTVFVGKVDERLKKIYRTVKDAHDRAIDHIRPGVGLSGIDRVARDHIEREGFGSYFGHGTGHGVGLNVHEWPPINRESKGVAEEGMVFTVEPGIYIPKVGGVRIEDMVLVTRGGCRVLTKIPKELTVIN